MGQVRSLGSGWELEVAVKIGDQSVDRGSEFEFRVGLRIRSWGHDHDSGTMVGVRVHGQG